MEQFPIQPIQNWRICASRRGGQDGWAILPASHYTYAEAQSSANQCKWVIAPLRKRTFFSLAALNQAIREPLEVLHNKAMLALGRSRRQEFEGIDRAAPDHQFVDQAYAKQLLHRAAAVRPHTHAFLKATLDSRPFPQQAYRSSHATGLPAERPSTHHSPAKASRGRRDAQVSEVSPLAGPYPQANSSAHSAT